MFTVILFHVIILYAAEYCNTVRGGHSVPLWLGQQSGIKVVSDCTCVTTDLGGVVSAVLLIIHSSLEEAIMCMHD